MSEKYRLPEEFFTGRFLVRRIRPSDADAIFHDWATDLEVTKYLTWLPHIDVSQTREYSKYAHMAWEQGTTFPAVISPRNNPHKLVGSIEARLSGQSVSYGWLIRRDSWGQGIMSEVAQWATEHALAHPMIFRTEATCDVMNGASARVMEKAGMTREALLRRYVLHPNISDTPRDAFIYSKVR